MVIIKPAKVQLGDGCEWRGCTLETCVSVSPVLYDVPAGGYDDAAG